MINQWLEKLTELLASSRQLRLSRGEQPFTVIEHYKGCTPFYPEKPDGELPMTVIDLDIEDGERVLVCGDCGACVIIKEGA